MSKKLQSKTNKIKEETGIAPINLAVQGGGAHGAFAWGVIDELLEDGRISFEAISGTSAGTMNALVLAYGLLEGGHEGAREKLYNFWKAISDCGAIYNPCKQLPVEHFFSGYHMDNCLAYLFCDATARAFSPYQLNPTDFNPLRDILLTHVDFEKLNKCDVTKLFLSATNVRTGQIKVFETHEITIDTAMASACLPSLFKAVEINGDYWDGGYSGNPALFPFFYDTKSSDILIIHVNPIERPAPPTLSHEIFNRVNEISFNSALLKEFRAISFVHKLLDEDMIKEEYRDNFKYILLHSIKADGALSDYSYASKFCEDWEFLTLLFNRGKAHAKDWLKDHYQDLGVRPSIDIKNQLVGLGHKES